MITPFASPTGSFGPILAVYGQQNVNDGGNFRGRRFSVSPPPDCRSGASCRGARRPAAGRGREKRRSEEHTSELQSLMRISYAVFCLKKKKKQTKKSRKADLIT